MGTNNDTSNQTTSTIDTGQTYEGKYPHMDEECLTALKAHDERVVTEASNIGAGVGGAIGLGGGVVLGLAITPALPPLGLVLATGGGTAAGGYAGAAIGEKLGKWKVGSEEQELARIYNTMSRVDCARSLLEETSPQPYMNNQEIARHADQRAVAQNIVNSAKAPGAKM